MQKRWKKEKGKGSVLRGPWFLTSINSLLLERVIVGVYRELDVM